MSTVSWRRRLEYGARRFGLPGGLGALLVVIAALYPVWTILPEHRRLESLEREVASAAAEARRYEEARDEAASPAEQIASFYQTFPSAGSVPDWLGKIYAIAAEDGLVLDSGEYVMSRTPSGYLDQYRIAFPVKGSYPSIRKFIADVLATAPAVALESVHLKRESVGEGVADARIVFQLYLERHG